MLYNTEYISLKCLLIDTFLLDKEKAILDISYEIADDLLVVQIVLLNGFGISNELRRTIERDLAGFKIQVKEITLSKAEFNESKGYWQPQNYTWLKYLLFSEAEVL